MVEAQVLAAWLTPTSLFVLLNILLATIFLAHNHSKNHSSAPPPQLVRAPSLLSRVASFNFSHHFYSDPPDPSASVARPPSLLYRVASFNFCRAPLLQGNENEEEARDFSQSHVMGERLLAEEDKKQQEEAEVEEKVVKVKKVKKKVKKEPAGQVPKAKVIEKTMSLKREDEEVDSKADDFINKFKQQLKLQRLESLVRYNRGEGREREKGERKLITDKRN